MGLLNILNGLFLPGFFDDFDFFVFSCRIFTAFCWVSLASAPRWPGPQRWPWAKTLMLRELIQSAQTERGWSFPLSWRGGGWVLGVKVV